MTMDGFDGDDPDDDMLRYFDFSQPEPLPPPPPPLPPPPLQHEEGLHPEENLGETQNKTTIWDMDTISPIIQALAGITVNDEMAGIPLSNTQDVTAEPNFVPFLPGDLDCNGCHVLREVVYMNGKENTKLTIHGSVGIFFHALFEIEDMSNGDQPAVQYFYLDISMQTNEWVKNFMIQYNLQMVNDGNIVVQDSLSSFYEALSGGINTNMATSSGTGSCSLYPLPESVSSSAAGSPASSPAILASPSILSAETPQFPLANMEGYPPMLPKTGIAAQRERTGNMGLGDLTHYFNLPISQAAKELQICSTALKHICRRHGIRRWPHRKIQSIDKRMSRLEAGLQSTRSSEAAATIISEMEKLRSRRAQVCAGER